MEGVRKARRSERRNFIVVSEFWDEREREESGICEAVGPRTDKEVDAMFFIENLGVCYILNTKS